MIMKRSLMIQITILLGVMLATREVIGHKMASHKRVAASDEDDHAEKRFASFFQKSAGNMVAQDRQKQKSQLWRWLPDRECSSDPCQSSSDCCKYASICHKQSKRCTECMFRDPCTTDAQCCSSFSYCDNPTKEQNAGQCINVNAA